MARPIASYAVQVVRFFWFCILTLLFVSIAQAQQYPFVDITPPDAPRGCFFMLEDDRGGLWLAGCETGAEGLFYFDGEHFIRPLKEPFPKVDVSGMVMDSEGGIWITSSGGLFRFHRGSLTKFLDGAGSAGITRVDSDVFIATVARPGHSPLLDADLIRIMQVRGRWQAETILTGMPQVQFRVDPAGKILYGCDGGYCEVPREAVAGWRPDSALAITPHKAQTHSSYASAKTVIWRDRFGCVWMRGTNDAAYQCPGDIRPLAVPGNVASRGEPQIIELGDGQMVIASFGRLAIGRPGSFRVLTMLNGYPSAANILAVKDGLLISNANGLFFMPLRARFEFWSQRDGLNGNTWSVTRMGAKTFAIAGDAVNLLAPDRTSWRPWAKLRAGSGLLPGPHGTLLAGSHTEGVVQLRADGTVLRRSDPADVVMLTRTPDGQFWVGGGGIFQIAFTGSHLELNNVGYFPARSAGVEDMKLGADGSLWACYEGGLAHQEGSSWRLISTRQGLLQNECRSFAIDGNEDVWYSYANIPENALIEKPQSGPPTVRQLERGELGAPQSHFLNFDHRHWLWRGGADGVYVAEAGQAREGEWLRLTRQDGLPAVDTNQKSFFEDNDGSIWIGADSSIIHLFPSDDLLHPKYAPSLFLSSFSLNGGPPQMADSVESVVSGSDLIAHMGSLQFDRRNAVGLRYRLLPDHSSWQSGKDLNIRLGKLSSGRHTLEVQAQLGSGPWSPSVIASFTVLRPVWFSWRALVALALAVSFAAAGGYCWRRKGRNRAKKAFPELAEWRLAALSPEVSQLEGTVLDSRFEVGRVLARGGFATVTEGRDLQHQGRPCAVKIFRQELVNKDWMMRRFQQEVLALEQLHHPNVVGIWGHGTTPGGAPYLVMEFVDGKTLREVLEAAGLARLEAVSYLRQTARALAEIHAHGIFHRDLKPDNLMIRNDSPLEQRIVLIDFSIAIVKDADETLHGLSRAAGTMYYMAPEQAIGYADASTDIHSLAKVIIEMLTGKRLSDLFPDAAMDLPARVGKFLRTPSFGLSSSAINLISAALEFDPSRRPHNASEFGAAVTQDLECVASAATPSLEEHTGPSSQAVF
jgi:tRNA A-37 threonylcarbamoyl transferase component Bud32